MYDLSSQPASVPPSTSILVTVLQCPHMVVGSNPARAGADPGICIRGTISLPLPPPLPLSSLLPFPYSTFLSPPSPSPPSSPLPSYPFPFPPLRSRPSVLRLGGLGERSSSPSGSGRSPAAKRFLVNCRLKIAPVVAMVTKYTST